MNIFDPTAVYEDDQPRTSYTRYLGEGNHLAEITELLGVETLTNRNGEEYTQMTFQYSSEGGEIRDKWIVDHKGEKAAGALRMTRANARQLLRAVNPENKDTLNTKNFMKLVGNRPHWIAVRKNANGYNEVTAYASEKSYLPPVPIPNSSNSADDIVSQLSALMGE